MDEVAMVRLISEGKVFGHFLFDSYKMARDFIDLFDERKQALIDAHKKLDPLLYRKIKFNEPVDSSEEEKCFEVACENMINLHIGVDAEFSQRCWMEYNEMNFRKFLEIKVP